MTSETSGNPTKACCGVTRDDLGAPKPAGNAAPAPTPTQKITPNGASDKLEAMIAETLTTVPGGFFDMGARQSRYPDDHDSPRRRVHQSEFAIGKYAVTNRIFAQFIAESGYETTAQTEGWSYVFHLFLDNIADFPGHVETAPWWRQVFGATWAHPTGPNSHWQDVADHPVTHVSWYDAQAFCAFTGTQLPSESQWEKAARGGLVHKKFPWEGGLTPGGIHKSNVWQGQFPDINTADDGHLGTAPVDAYEPNGYGIYNMTGNVWEWCADWFGPAQIAKRPLRDPLGPDAGPGRVVRGGSYLCHASYCERYQTHSRTQNTADSSTGHTGFRIARPPAKEAK